MAFKTVSSTKAVETRNFTGTQLIDRPSQHQLWFFSHVCPLPLGRNDELCILWEKANIQVLRQSSEVFTVEQNHLPRSIILDLVQEKLLKKGEAGLKCQDRF